MSGRIFTDATNTTTPSANGVTGILDKYSLLDFSSEYNFLKNYNIRAGINNLFDEANSVKDIINIQKYLANPTDNNLQNVNEEAQSLALTLNDMAKKSNNPQFLTDAISYAEGVSDEEPIAREILEPNLS